jgi:hypothetical protein
MDRRRRLMFASIVLLAIVECFWFLFVGALEWNIRGLLLRPGDPQIALNTRTAVADFTWMVVNVIGLLAFVMRNRGFGRWLMVGVQLFDVVNMAYAGVRFALDGSWDTAFFVWVITAVPAMTFLLVLWSKSVGAVEGHLRV